MRHGSLFSGLGGFDLAAEWMGWENVLHCEINEFCQKILNYYWPNATSYTNIIKTDFTKHRGEIDIITGGFPCQPYSTAGKRKGKADDRHLWPEMLRAIREIQPSWIVGENVPGLLNWKRGMVLAEIKADLEASGFEVFAPVILPACGKNAPHRRDRLWIVAYSIDNRHKAGRGKETEKDGLQEISRPAMDTWKFNGTNISSTSTNTKSNDHKQQRGKIDTTRQNVEGREAKIRVESSRCYFDATHTDNTGLQGSKINGSINGIGENGNEQFAGLLQSDWKEFPTQSPLCGGNDGVPNRVDRIKALGNAIVPQVAYEIFKAIEFVRK